MARMDWLDLADSELRARLTQRGLDPAEVERLVAYRDEAMAQRTITKALT